MKIKVTHYQLQEIEQLIEIAQKRLRAMSNFSVLNYVLEKYHVSDLSDIKASDGEQVLRDIQDLMFKKYGG